MEIFAGYLGNDKEHPEVHVTNALFGQVEQTLLNSNSDIWKTSSEYAVVWTRPEAVITSFQKVLQFETVPIDTILHQVDRFASLIINASARLRSIFVPAWTVPDFHRGFGMLNMQKDRGIENILMQMNLRLSENLSGTSNIFLLDSKRWVNSAGRRAFNQKLWYRGKIAFGNNVYREAVRDIKAALRGVSGCARKIIILDLDNTLWGGVVGDIGWENIALGGHDPAGEAYIDFQEALKSMTNRGIILGIVSKNEESVALQAINKHPEMRLSLKDIAGWKINWQDKAQNIVDLLSDLNLGVQSAVFIDDNPRERLRVREALPEVYVPDWPSDAMLYRESLLSLRCFDVPALSREDQARAKMYVSDKERQKLKDTFQSVNDWLASLKTTITVEELSRASLQRASQLFNKTNQMNLTTRRMTENELYSWANMENHKL